MSTQDNRQDIGAPPPGHRQDVDRTPVTVAEASERLGISTDAIRKKLQRGTLPGEKVAGEWRVFVPVQDDRQDATDTRQDTKQDTTGTRQDTDRTWRAADDGPLIEQLQSEVAYLRGELSRAIEQAGKERERADILHREALQRIEALSAGGYAQEPPTASPTGAGSEQSPESTPSTLTPEPERPRGWLRRLLGV